MPISCHFQDCEALLFTSLLICKQRYIKYIQNFTCRSVLLTCSSVFRTEVTEPVRSSITSVLARFGLFLVHQCVYDTKIYGSCRTVRYWSWFFADRWQKSPMFSNGDHPEIPLIAGHYHLLVDRYDKVWFEDGSLHQTSHWQQRR